MERIFEIVKARIEETLKTSKLWPLAHNNKFFENMLLHPDAKVGIAEGDSWFDYDFISKFIHGTGEDLIGHLCDDGTFGILRLSFAGDTLEDMAREPQLSHVREAMKLLKRISEMSGSDRFALKFVMLSGGGNDFSGNKGVRLKKFVSDQGFDRDSASRAIHVDFRERYMKMIANLRSVDRHIPIFVHGYAYPIPDGRGVRHYGIPADYEIDFEGPWLQPAFDNTGISAEEQQEIIIELIDMFNLMLSGLQDAVSKTDANFNYVDLRPCLPKPPYAGYQNDWANELHPTSDGFRVIADKFRKEILARIG